MKISDLNDNDAETLRFAARGLDGINKPLADPPTSSQILSLRFNNYVIGPDQHVYRICVPGVLLDVH